MNQDLIRKARSLSYIDWPQIEGLIEQAEDEETKEKLKWIMRRKELLEQIKC